MQNYPKYVMHIDKKDEQLPDTDKEIWGGVKKL